jgi:hypothetical protein
MYKNNHNAMVIKYVISPYPALLENMVVKIWEAASDGAGAEVFTQVIPERDGTGTPTPGAGHQVPYVLIANGLDKVVHIVRLYSAVSANLLHEYNLEPVTDIVQVFDPIRFKIGDGGILTPIAGTTTYTNSILAGYGDDDYIVHRNNYGNLFPNVHYTTNNIAGNFVLNDPDVFGDNEEFTVQITPKVIQSVVNDSVVGKWFSDFVNIAAHTVYSSTHLRKLIRFTAAPVNYTFQVTDSVPIGYTFCFQGLKLAAGAGAGTIKFNNGPLIWGTGTKSEIDILAFQEGAFVWDGTNWNVVYLTDSSFVNAASVLPLSIVAAGEVYAGDIPAGDPTYVVNHAKNISGDYMVMLSVRSKDPATYVKNNKIGLAWYHHATDKANKFVITPQELAAEAQDCYLCWLIIKT